MKRGDKVRVVGTSNKFRKSLIKADKIHLLDEELKETDTPVCKCSRLNFSIKRLIRKDFDENGLVLSVTETKDGFWFNMELIEKT